MAWGTPLERFWQKVDKRSADDCWLWTGGKKAAGYGQFSVEGKKVIAHRFAYREFRGELPDGYEIDHICRNRSCVNPEHLDAVPLAVNRERRNAAKTHCTHGHEYTAANIRWQPGSDGYTSRVCRTCERAKNARQYAARSKVSQTGG